MLANNKSNGGKLFILLGVDATLGNGCRIQEHLHSLRKIKYLKGCSNNFWMDI